MKETCAAPEENRGGKGVKCYKITEKTGNLIGVKAVNEDNEIMMITTEGIVIRMPVSGISIQGRVTSGVKLMNLEGDVTVASIEKVREATETSKNEDVEQKETVESQKIQNKVEAMKEKESVQIQKLLDRAQEDQEDKQP